MSTTALIEPTAAPSALPDRTRAVQDGRELTANSVGQLIGLTAAAGRAHRPARIHLQIDTGSGDGCSADAWPLLVAVACRLSRTGRVEILGVRPGRAADGDDDDGDDHATPGDDASERFERAVVQARRLGLRALCTG